LSEVSSKELYQAKFSKIKSQLQFKLISELVLLKIHISELNLYFIIQELVNFKVIFDETGNFIV